MNYNKKNLIIKLLNFNSTQRPKYNNIITYFKYIRNKDKIDQEITNDIIL